jgi:hypothetical protein
MPVSRQNPLRLIAWIKAENIAKKTLTAVHLPAEISDVHSAHPLLRQPGAARTGRTDQFELGEDAIG